MRKFLHVLLISTLALTFLTIPIFADGPGVPDQPDVPSKIVQITYK